MNNSKYVLANPPRCLAPFAVTPAQLPDTEWDGHGEKLNPVFLANCTCGSSAHRIHGFSWENPDYPGQRIFLSPIELTCASCSKRTLLLDTDVHGYDAELGHGTGTARAQGDAGNYRCKSCSGELMEVLVRFEYPEDVFGDDFKDFRSTRADLFTWVSIVGSCTGCWDLGIVADYECA